MARIAVSRITTRVLGTDFNGNSVQLAPWGITHNLSPAEGSPVRNSTPFSSSCGVVSVIAIGAPAHFKQGDSSVVAATTDPYLPADVWVDVLVPEGAEWSYISVISAAGSGAISAQIVERAP